MLSIWRGLTVDYKKEQHGTTTTIVKHLISISPQLPQCRSDLLLSHRMGKARRASVAQRRGSVLNVAAPKLAKVSLFQHATGTTTINTTLKQTYTVYRHHISCQVHPTLVTHFLFPIQCFVMHSELNYRKYSTPFLSGQTPKWIEGLS